MGYLPTGSKGLDCNWPLDSGQARGFYARGHRFAVRYVGRRQMKVHDVTRTEIATLRGAGLAVMLVQHVALPGWRPDRALGEEYGTNAAKFARAVGYERGAVLWCDLEEVSREATRRDVIEYCNGWYDEVHAAGYEPGLYVGYGAGLGAQDLYHALKFQAYWASYNLDADRYPAVRGVQMRQHAAGPSDKVPGVNFEIDVNLIGKDRLGGTPKLMLAPGDR